MRVETISLCWISPASSSILSESAAEIVNVNTLQMVWVLQDYENKY